MTSPGRGKAKTATARAPEPLPLLLLLLLAMGSAASGLGGCRGKYIRATTSDKFEPTAERLQRGQYLVNQVMACGACHTSRATGNPLMEGEQTDLFLAGGNTYSDRAGTTYVPNITPDVETGIGGWTDDEILRAVRDGVAKDGHFLLPILPHDPSHPPFRYHLLLPPPLRPHHRHTPPPHLGHNHPARPVLS